MAQRDTRDEIRNAELARRARIWARLRSLTDPESATPEALDAAGIRRHRTGQGIFREIESTRSIAPEGVTVALLATATTYADAFDEDAGIYHYPETKRGGRDASEISATKSAARHRLPVFVVLPGPTASTRRVRRGWVERWNDDARVFLITFGDAPSAAALEQDGDEAPFKLRSGRRPSALSRRVQRPGQARFAEAVLRRCGASCMFCGTAIKALLEAAHVFPVSQGGTDDPRNGLIACRNHHRAFDTQLVGINPRTLRLMASKGGPSLIDLGITCRSFAKAAAAPHSDALDWRWRKFTKGESIQVDE